MVCHRWIGMLVLGLAAASAGAEGPTLDGFERFVRADGSFTFPGESVREGLVHLGSWFVPEGDTAGFHHKNRVWASPRPQHAPSWAPTRPPSRRLT